MWPKGAALDRPAFMVAADQLKKNDGQWQAYNSTGNCVILAGPGSGKTNILTIKVARILAEDLKPPRGIACITYNNQCARELKRKLSNLGVINGRRVFIGTLHSFCLRHIVLPYAHLTNLPIKYPLTVASRDDSERLQEKAIDETGVNDRWGPRYDSYRRTHFDRRSEAWRSDDEQAAQVIEKYEFFLSEQGLIDFDGIVLTGLHLVQNLSWVQKALIARFPVIVIDEYQDLGYALDRMVRNLSLRAGIRVIAVGDPDQSIYGFTGADPSLLSDLAKHPKIEVVRLRLNYRCGSSIIKASEIALGETRGFLSCREEPGEVFFHARPDGIVDQATFICREIIPAAIRRKSGRKVGDIAVLYLDRDDGEVMAKEASEADYQFVRVDGNNPYQPSPVTYWLEDCAAWCSGGWRTGKVSMSDLVRQWEDFNESVVKTKEQNNANAVLVKFLYANRYPDMPLSKWLSQFLDQGLKTCLDREPRLRDDNEKVQRLLQVTSDGGPLQAFTVSFFGGQGGSPDHLTLTTLHSAKGLEYDVVIIIGVEEGRIPYYSDSPDTVREKRRLFYVGLTRARQEVHLVYSGWYKRFGRVFRNGRSRFVDEVAETLIS